jgi:UDP-N-acetylmuramate--alanine ligase
LEIKEINLDEVRHIHLMGIGGAGMSGLALLLKELGFDVSGCDMSYGFYVEKVAQADIDFNIGHSSDHLSQFSPDLLVYSSAIPEDNEELVVARESGIAVAQRAQVLSAIFDVRYGIGVAGTHGKTTTSSMIGLILSGAGLEPTVAIGGELCDIGCNARLGSGPHMVAELDESDGSFLCFHPTISVITNVDWDHVNHYPDFDSVLNTFESFSQNLRKGGLSVLCGEDGGVQSLLKMMEKDSPKVTYGWGDRWDWGATDIEYNHGGGVSFSVRKHGRSIGRIELSVSGDHNVLNALASCIVADILSVPFDVIKRTLRQFKGAKRRLQFKGGVEHIDVYDDYGHHPREVEATLKAISQIFPERKILVAFQPHRFTRTAAMAENFAEVLTYADKVVVLPIYPADEPPVDGVTSHMIGDHLSKKNHPSFFVTDRKKDAIDKVMSLVEEGDVILTLGAGDIADLGDILVKEIGRKNIVPRSIAVGV